MSEWSEGGERSKSMKGKDTLEQKEREERELLELLFEESISNRKEIAAYERELERARDALRREQQVREKKFLKEIEEREQFFSERERMLFDRQREMEEVLRKRYEEIEFLRNRLEVDISKKEAELAVRELAVESEKARYTEDGVKKLEVKSQNYVSEAISSLEKNEKDFHVLAKKWSVFGAASLIVGVLFFLYVSVSGVSSIILSPSWEVVAFFAFKGGVSVAVIGALARYAFMFSRSYMHEALKNGNRRHAINFGKFYLETYGAAADWSQIKEAFEHWNISDASAFSNDKDGGEYGISEKIAGIVVDKFVKIGEKASKNSDK